MYFRLLHDDTSGELTYLLADADAREAVLIDPRDEFLSRMAALPKQAPQPVQSALTPRFEESV